MSSKGKRVRRRLGDRNECVAFSRLALNHRGDRRLTKDLRHLDHPNRIRNRVQEIPTRVPDFVHNTLNLVA